MEIITNKILVNSKYYIAQIKKNNICITSLKDQKEDKTICESGNIYAFIEKVKCYCKINKTIQTNIMNFYSGKEIK